MRFNQQGQAFGMYGPEPLFDVENLPEKVAGYVNVYRVTKVGPYNRRIKIGDHYTGGIYNTRAAADTANDVRFNSRSSTRIACIRLEIEEGRFDE
jgi:hypothetical protein